jgi:hypothetical protein
MAEAIACGCYPITSDIGALREVSFDRGKYIPMLGENTSSGWKPSSKFINEFAQKFQGVLISLISNQKLSMPQQMNYQRLLEKIIIGNTFLSNGVIL